MARSQEIHSESDQYDVWMLRLERAGILNSLTVEAFDRLTRLATRLLHVPGAFISLALEEREVIVNSLGHEQTWRNADKPPVSLLLCRHVIRDRSTVVVEDARNHSLVNEEATTTILDVVAYLGTPLIARNGSAIGTLCAVDYVVRSWSQEDVDGLAELAETVMTVIDAGTLAREAQESAERHSLFTALIENSTDFIGVASPDWRTVFVNRSGQRLLGIDSHEELLRTSLPDCFPSRERQRIMKEIVHGLQKRGHWNGEVVLCNFKTGDRIPVVLHVLSLKTDTSGEISAIVWSTRDVRERKRAADELRSSEIRFKTVWESATDAMALSDPDGIVVAANPAYYRMYDYGPDEILGHSFAVIFPEEQRDWAISEYKRTFAEANDLHEAEAVVRPHSGPERIVDVRYNFVEQDGVRIAMLSVIRDVTERARLVASEREHAKRKDEFLLTVSHDLKNPLTSIQGFSQWLLRQMDKPIPPDPSRLRGGLEQIAGTTARMTRLIDEILDVTRLQSGEPLALQLNEVEVGALVQEAVSDQAGAADQREITIELPQSPLVGLWDVSRIRRVLDNLLSNALKYSPDGGSIVVSMDREVRSGADWAVLRVRDEGIGISESDKARIFEQFYRSDAVQTRITGSGIGLVGARRIIEQHGGDITVESVLGQGSTFTVRLPLKPASTIEDAWKGVVPSGDTSNP